MNNEIKTPRTDAAVQIPGIGRSFVAIAILSKKLEIETVELREQLDNIKASTTIAKFDELQKQLTTSVAMLSEVLRVANTTSYCSGSCASFSLERAEQIRKFLESNKPKL